MCKKEVYLAYIKDETFQFLVFEVFVEDEEIA